MDAKPVLDKYSNALGRTYAQWQGERIQLELRLEEVTQERNAAVTKAAELQNRLNAYESETAGEQTISIGAAPEVR